MSGLLALLDDVAALTKLAAAQLDDVTAQATKVGVKTAGILIDDTAVTPKYVHGLPAARELPIVWQIARGSLFNKLVILLPIAMLLNLFAPWLLSPLLMIGGAYLCFEGAEKVWHFFHPVPIPVHVDNPIDHAHLEKQRVAGAIKTDFILSAEIMTIALSSIESGTLWMEGLVLAVVAVGITVLVYGSVAVLVKADDVGLKMAQAGYFSLTRSIGRGIVHGMPAFMETVATIGTAAMLWVGGSIIIHGLEGFGLSFMGHLVADSSAAVREAVAFASGFLGWATEALISGIFGLAVGLALLAIISLGKRIFKRG
jgi:predicted DNA repair protein MutK